MTTIPDHALHEAISVLLRHATRSSSEPKIRPPKQELPESFFFTQLDEEATQLEQIHSIFNNNIIHRITNLRRRRNLLTPFYRLPAELLIDVFALAVDSEAHHGRFKALKNLASISSRCFGITLSHPFFWVHLHSKDHPALTRSAISRSRNALLHISCTGAELDVVQETNFLQLVAPHVSRWRTFESSSPYTAVLLPDILTAGYAPHLELFEVESSYLGLSTFELPQPIQNSAPRLKRLDTTSFSFPLESKSLFNLQSLSFSPYIADSPFNADQWHQCLSIIAGSPHLEFVNIQGRPSTPGFAISLPEVVMSYQKTIFLQQLSSSLIGSLLSSILTVPNIRPSISIIDPSDFAVHRVFLEPHSESSLLDVIRHGTDLEIIWGGGSFVVSWSGSTSEFYLTMNDSLFFVTRGILGSLFSPISNSNVRTMRLQGRDLLRSFPFNPDFRMFTNLERLIIEHETTDRQTERNLETTLMALSIPDPFQTPLSWALPRLKYLRITGINDLLPVWKFVQRRYRDIGQHSFYKSMLPDPLEELSLETIVDKRLSTDPGRSLIRQLEEFSAHKNIVFSCEALDGAEGEDE